MKSLSTLRSEPYGMESYRRNPGFRSADSDRAAETDRHGVFGIGAAEIRDDGVVPELRFRIDNP